MRVELPEPLAPHGGKVTIAMDYAFAVPEHGSDRMGRDGAAVRDRAVVSADGRVRRRARLEHRSVSRAGRVLSRVRRHRLRRDRARRIRRGGQRRAAESAGRADAPQQRASGWRRRRTATSIVRDHHGGRGEAPYGDVRERRRGASARSTCATWRGRRRPTSAGTRRAGSGVLAQAYYEWPKAGAEWEHAAEKTQWTIRTYSQLVLPFPYPQATSVAGPVGGMEYPMFVMVNYAVAGVGSERRVRHARSRARPRVVPDDRGLERAAVRVDGRRVQHVHQHVLERAAIRRATSSGRSTWTTGRRACSRASSVRS